MASTKADGLGLGPHGDVPMVVRAMQSGAVDFLQKPFNSQQFLDRVNAAIKHDLEAREKRHSTRQLAQGLLMLTPREREILELALSGESSKRIANALKISHKTVEVHRAHIVKNLMSDLSTKLGARSLQADR